MTFLQRLTSPVRGYRLLRRVLVELRGMRRALERHADVLELANSTAPRDTVGGQVFRSYSRAKGPLSDKDVQELTDVSYVDDRMVGAMLAKEEELRAILGRDPTPEEINRAYRGDIE